MDFLSKPIGVKIMEKSKLFICGDSWVDWNYPKKKLHWTSYLEEHYEVFKLGIVNMDNTSIVNQLGNIPDYQEGDRIILVFTDPQRVNRRYYIKDFKKLDSWLSYPLRTWANSDIHMINQELMETKLWDANMRQDEINFYRKLKTLLKDYNPIFFTWSFHFHKLTKDFAEYIEVSSLENEGVRQNDGHPGIIGSYDFYQKTLERLDNTLVPATFRGNKYIL
jgi:hypothetical protein